MQPRSVIVGTGSYIPPVRVPNDHFLDRDFRMSDGSKLSKTNHEIVAQFEAITGIRERRYAPADVNCSDMAYEAAKAAIESSGVDPETLDYIIVAHNFGDVRAGIRSDLVPALAARVKAKLQIRSPRAVCFDVVFGCPGWLQGMIIADAFIKSGSARRALVIGSETLSRVSDPHDRDSLIYADGAGATILEARDSDDDVGVLSHAVRSDTIDHWSMLSMKPSYNDASVFLEALFLKMEGRKLYKYALQTVAGSMKKCLDDAGLTLADVDKILLHQANGKMDEAILENLYDIYGMQPPDDVLPMTIGWLGNSSVATVPTLLDLISKGQMNGHSISSGDILLFASVGAGMNINAMAYRVG
jgi:3-oxoacyl-[acyl-carrier-protein] synthase III